MRLRLRHLAVLTLAAASIAHAQEPPMDSASPTLNIPPAAQQQQPAPIERQDAPQQPAPLPPPASYDDAIFQRLIPPAELKGLDIFANMPTGEALKDRNLRKLVHSILPGDMYHYGRDMTPADAFDSVLNASSTPVLLRDHRFLILSGDRGPYLRGTGMIWIDTQTGQALAVFYFHPTNGEPTPSLTVLTRQIKEPAISLGQLPPDFALDLATWSSSERIAPVTIRYFIGDNHQRLLLEHDEDFCTADPRFTPRGTNAAGYQDCEQLNADAADLDMTAAYYLEQIHYATNGTAWMIVGQDQTAFLRLRESRCSTLADPLPCRIRLTRDHIHTITPRPVPHPIHR
jgi:hypothetical protein